MCIFLKLRNLFAVDSDKALDIYGFTSIPVYVIHLLLYSCAGIFFKMNIFVINPASMNLFQGVSVHLSHLL